MATLIEAYRRLEDCAHRGNALDFSKFESAIADVQLFGTKRQVELCQDLVLQFAENKSAEMIEFLQDLRRELRIELNLPKVPDQVLTLRWRAEPTDKPRQLREG
jgi:hypothetical protein